MKPFNFQTEAVEKILAAFDTSRGFLLADDTGLGKTRTALMAAHAMFEKKDALIVIVCPSFLKPKWFAEVKKWLPEKRPYSFVMYGYTDLTKPGHKKYIMGQDIDLLILDESHYCKDFKSQRTQAALGHPRKGQGVARVAKRVLGLSATPIPNGRVGEFFSWLWATDHPLAKGHSFESFVMQWAKYYRVTPYGLTHKGINNEKKFRAALASNYLQRKKHEVFDDLPEYIRDNIPLAISNAMLKKETALLKELMNKAGYGKYEVEYLLKNPQLFEKILAAVPSFDEWAKFKLQSGLAKVPAAVEYFKNIVLPDSSKFICFVNHKEVAKAYAEQFRKLKKPVEIISGDDSPEDRFAKLEEIKQKKEVILIATMHSVKEGFDLVEFSQAYFLELDPVPGLLIQCEGRLLRIGQKSTVFYNYLTFENGMDKYVLKMLAEKTATIQKILD